MKKIIAVNAGPRKGWNTDRLVKAAGNGAEENGFEVEYIDLYQLPKFTGCMSCFGCKREATYGKCVIKDGLYEVLEKISGADGLIIGSPNYLGDLSAGFRSLYERLIFRSLTYNKEEPNCNKHRIPVLLIMTSNCDESVYEQVGYNTMLERYRRMLTQFVGDTEIYTCGNTLQVNDYSQFKWTVFDPAEKKKHHEETFGNDLAEAEAVGKRLF